MKAKIHPEYEEVTIVCGCGNRFITRSTLQRKNLTLEVCSNCHPFYTGTQKLLDTGGRIDRFRQKYARKDIPHVKESKNKEEDEEAKNRKKPVKLKNKSETVHKLKDKQKKDPVKKELAKKEPVKKEFTKKELNKKDTT